MIDFLIELLIEVAAELTAEGTVELSKNAKVPKWVRYLLIGLIVLFFIGVVGLIVFAGLLMLEEYVLFGVILLVGALILLAVGIAKFRKTYQTRKNENLWNHDLS
jgi:biotin transporter BioY